MTFSNRSRKNTKIQKKNCVKRTFVPTVTAVWKFSTLKKEGGLEFGKLQTAISRASGVRLTRFFFWIRVFFRYLRNQTASRRFARADFAKNVFYWFLYEQKRAEGEKREFGQGGWVFQIDLEKIRGIKKKIASNGRPSRELRPFENSAP